MKNLVILACAATFMLAGCETTTGSAVASNPNLQKRTSLPDEVKAKAAPGQDLSDIRIDARDGCLMYRYSGPVETTYIPLRNRQGRPICVKQEAEGAAEA